MDRGHGFSSILPWDGEPAVVVPFVFDDVDGGLRCVKNFFHARRDTTAGRVAALFSDILLPFLNQSKC